MSQLNLHSDSVSSLCTVDHSAHRALERLSGGNFSPTLVEAEARWRWVARKVKKVQRRREEKTFLMNEWIAAIDE